MHQMHMYMLHLQLKMYIEHQWHLLMAEQIVDRSLQLIDLASLKELAEAGGTDYVRWQNIKRGRARVGAEEIEILGRVFPTYRWWLITGEVAPENGQTSPSFDEANRNLNGQYAG